MILFLIVSVVSCFSGDWTLPCPGSGNLSVEHVCGPRALQCLLVCSIHFPVLLQHHVQQRRLSISSGHHVLPAYKVWCLHGVDMVIIIPWSRINWMSGCVLQCVWMLCHTILSPGSDLCGVIFGSWPAQLVQVLPGRLCSSSEWERYAQVRCFLMLFQLCQCNSFF